MRFGYCIVYVSNIEATVSFYELAFGITCRFINESSYAEMETRATALVRTTGAKAASCLSWLSLNKRLAAEPRLFSCWE